MALLPQLLEEDVHRLNSILKDLLGHCDASLALITDKAGFLLAEQGSVQDVDTTALASLASGSFLATQAIAKIIQEPSFNSVYQQGQKFNLLVQNVDDSTVLIVIFPAQVSAGLVKFFSSGVIDAVAAQMSTARSRAPGAEVDPAGLNLKDVGDLFKRRQP